MNISKGWFYSIIGILIIIIVLLEIGQITTVALVLRHGGLSPFRKLSKRAKIKGA